MPLRRKNILIGIALLPLLYLLLLIPDAGENSVQQAGGKPFAWNRDAFWQSLEQRFLQAKSMEAAALDTAIAALSSRSDIRLSGLQNGSVEPGDPRLDSLLEDFFAMAPLVAVRQERVNGLIEQYRRARQMLKEKSGDWPLDSASARNSLYKTVYGMRAAIEEVLLQSGRSFDPVMPVSDEASATPSVTLFGTKVHSGDLLVSRGGAEVSALISRGNDYPGNFSHVALIYIDSARQPWLVEAHIERGVAIAGAEQYIRDKKLRFMVLRPRAELPAIAADPLLPQKAARAAYDEAQRRHIPYDFRMNFYDSTAMFCSEVGSWAYGRNGIRLWRFVSTISSRGVTDWLNTFGVENFVTQMPSDLEYDPQLSVVAEWRDPETLRKDHTDNAVMDVLLERAERGERISYNIWMLPVARAIKAWSWLMNRFGRESVIPEGMNATRALKNNTFVAMHADLKERTERAVREFRERKGYMPPYWQLLRLAREADKKRQDTE